MITPLSRLAAIALVWIAACAGTDQVGSPYQESTTRAGQALGAAQSNAAVLVLDSGHYSRYVYRGASSHSFWVDLSVRNDTPQKEVGVLWTNDNWQTSHTSLAGYEGALFGGRERWGIDVNDFATTWGGQPNEVEYAAYVKMNGQTHWSPFRNHYIYQRVTPSAPVRLFSSSVGLDAAGEPVLSGVVRALNLASPRKVFVRYSTDAWLSFGEGEATFDGKDFAFSIKLPFNAQTTEQVEFVVRLEAEGEVYWDNNSYNYRHRLAPSFTSFNFQDDGLTPASGLRVLSAAAVTDLTLSQVWVRFDGGPRVALPRLPTGSYEQANGFSPSGGVSYAFAVASLSEGPHALVVEAAAGPFVRSSDPLAFTVDNSIRSLTSWDLSTGETPWDLELAADGRAYVMRESRIDLYTTVGALSPERVFLSPSPSRLLDISVDKSGRVYANNGSSVYRFLASGELDASFANAGTLDLNGNYADRALCYAANVQATKNYLYVVDSCNARVLRFGFAGEFVAELDLSEGDIYAIVTRTFDDGERLWVGVDTYADSRLAHRLVAISDESGEAPAVVDSLLLDPSLQNLDAFTLTPDGGVWATTVWQQLYRLDGSGVAQELWTGGGRLMSLPGAISIGRAICVLADGSVLVLSVDTAKVERFELAPR